MKLHSYFHDYYDNAIGYGVDEKVHYNRYFEEVEIRLKSSADRPYHRRSGILGFCGTLFPFIQLSRFDKKRECDLIDDFDGEVIEEYFAFSLDEYLSSEQDWSEYSNDFGYLDKASHVKLKQYFVDWKTEDDTVFREFDVPIWLMRFFVSGNNGVLNPILKDMGFERIKDPYTAFQDISMYISNVLIEQKPISSVEDKHRIEQHGFDVKTSFRNRKKSTS